MKISSARLTWFATILIAVGCSGDDPNGGGTANPAALVAEQSGGGEPPPIPDGPNIVLISIDTLRPDHLGCYGYQRPTSPTIDGLAAAGVLFEDCSSPAPWTLPAHASMLTGMYPSRHGVTSAKHELSAITLADVLKRRGYATAAIVNYLDVSKRFGLNKGFRQFQYLQESISSPEPSGVAIEAEKWLAKPRKRPFFLFLHFYDVHSDYTSLPNYEKQFASDYSGTMTGRTSDLIKHVLKCSLSAADVGHLLDLYDASIRQIDDSVRRVLEALESPELDNTIVVLTSDHGEEFVEHGSVLHGQDHYQEVARVPLLLRGPGIPAGKRVSTMACLVDVMPTLLGLASVPAPDGIDGIDLQPVWMGDADTASDRFLFAEADLGYKQHDRKRMIRNDRYKLHFDRESESVELYDLIDDPGEQTDVASEQPELVSLLRRELATFMQGQGSSRLAKPLTPQEIERLRALGYLR